MRSLPFAALVLCTLASGCRAVESASVKGDEVLATGGEAYGVVQANAMGFSLFFHALEPGKADLDVVVNELLVQEAKALGADKVEIKSLSSTPRHGIYRLVAWPLLFNILFGFTFAEATGVAVKVPAP